jgi:hypothetical protein
MQRVSLRVGPRLRVGGALITAAAATGWLLDRLRLPNAFAGVADSAGAHNTAMATGLAVSAALASAWVLANRRNPRVKELPAPQQLPVDAMARLTESPGWQAQPRQGP